MEGLLGGLAARRTGWWVLGVRSRVVDGACSEDADCGFVVWDGTSLSTMCRPRPYESILLH